MFKSLRSSVLASVMLLGLAVVSLPAHAQIDVTGATTAISDGVTAVTAIITALLVAYGGFLGLRMALKAVKRG